MKRASVSIVAVLIAVLLVAWWRHPTEPAAASPGTPGGSTTALAAPAQRRPQSFLRLPANKTMKASDPAEQVLQSALKTFALAELEKRHATNPNARFFIGGFQRKMFMDDYNYAALISGVPSVTTGETAYSNVVVQAASLSDADLEQQEGLEVPATTEGAGKMRQFYSLAVNSTERPAYREILEALQPVAPDADSTDLLKDAWTFVSARTEIGNMTAELQTDIENTRQWHLTNNVAWTPRRAEDEFQPAADAMQRLFAARFASHGLDPDTAFERLNGLTLSNVATEIWITPQLKN